LKEFSSKKNKINSLSQFGTKNFKEKINENQLMMKHSLKSKDS